MNPEILKYIETHALGQTSYGYGSGAEAKIAKTVMIELVKAGHADFLLLRDEVVAKWWGKMVTDAQKAIDLLVEKKRIYQIKMTAWERLTVEERKVLGLVKAPVKPKG